MGLDVIGILSILVAVVGVGGTMGGLALRGIGTLTKKTDNLSGQIKRVQKELRGELKSEIAGVRDELKGELVGVRDELKGEIAGLRGELKSDIAGLRGELKSDIAGLRDRIDAVHSEMVEARVTMSDRVARLEGSVFGVPLPDTGTDPA